MVTCLYAPTLICTYLQCYSVGGSSSSSHGSSGGVSIWQSTRRRALSTTSTTATGTTGAGGAGAAAAAAPAVPKPPSSLMARVRIRVSWRVFDRSVDRLAQEEGYWWVDRLIDRRPTAAPLHTKPIHHPPNPIQLPKYAPLALLNFGNSCALLSFCMYVRWMSSCHPTHAFIRTRPKSQSTLALPALKSTTSHYTHPRTDVFYLRSLALIATTCGGAYRPKFPFNQQKHAHRRIHSLSDRPVDLHLNLDFPPPPNTHAHSDLQRHAHPAAAHPDGLGARLPDGQRCVRASNFFSDFFITCIHPPSTR